MPSFTPDPVRRWQLFVPKLVTVLREGYSPAYLRQDIVAGLTVAIVALPLAMALAIASGATPDKGIITAIVAGFLISALGGSRFQIGGPTGAFVVVVFNVIAQHGYDGLVVATLMAGIMIILAGVFRLGTFIKYVPQPVITGFTAGIAVIIFTSQIKDFLGLPVEGLPGDFFGKLAVMFPVLTDADGVTLMVSGGVLGLIILLKRVRPGWPGFLIAVALAAGGVWALGLPVDTIGSRFGGLQVDFGWPSVPDISLPRLAELFPSAFTIAFLASVESLLSALVADSMTGRRHRSNCELVAQGVANCASALVGGLPATGAIARTATNIRAGARTPVAGMAHAVFLLLFLLFLWPVTAFIPLGALAAVLVMVAWNMSEIDRFRNLLKAPPGDRLVLLLTFGLTVAVDLTVAIEVGVVLASVLFMHRMAQVVEIQADIKLLEEDIEDDAPREGFDAAAYETLPPGVISSVIRGPFFFGVAARLGEVLERIGTPADILILRMRAVPIIDSTGAAALEALIARASRQGTQIILTGVQAQPLRVLREMGVIGDHGDVMLEANFKSAIDRAAQLQRARGTPLA